MAQIHVPTISPFSVTGPLHGADDSHIQSHHLAYEIASLNRTLGEQLAQYEALIDEVNALQLKVKTQPSVRLNKQLSKSEKTLLNSKLPLEIKQLRSRIQTLNRDLFLMTKKV